MGLLDEVFIRKAQGARGPKAEIPITWDFVRELGEEDLPELLNPPSFDSTKTLAKLRERHHFLARLLAQGYSNMDACVMTGYAPAYVSDIKNNDPAFQELMNYYQGQTEGKFLEIHEQLAMLGRTAVSEIQDRLDEKAEEFTIAQLQDVAEMALDRSIAPVKGAGKGNGMASGAGAGVTLNIQFQSPEARPQVGPLIEAKVKVLEQDED